MTVYLLDVNILLSLHDSKHTFHEAALAWFTSISQDGWATCPITESGFVRIASNPNYVRLDGTPDVLAQVLEQTCTTGAHEFWGDTISPRSVLLSSLPISFNQITDIYLLALAVEHGGKLATFDEKIPAHVLPGGPEALEVIPKSLDLVP